MKTLMQCLFLVSMAILWSSPKAWAFPEAIRHKYNNCITCHVSPTGGGLVTDYGRALSAEIFSTASGSENEPSFLYGAVKEPEWLNLGGDFRLLDLYVNTPTVTQGRFFFMQDDLEGSVTVGKMTFDATVGREDYTTGNPTHNQAIVPELGDNGDAGEFISRRHYVLVNPADTYYIRAGRFEKAFGINTPEHQTATKQGLNWDQGTETYNLELSRLTEATNLFVTAVFGRPDDPNVVDTDKGIAASGNVFLGDRYKLGASYFRGARTLTNTSRQIAGPWLLAGVTDRLFVEAEADYEQVWQTKTFSGSETNGLAFTAKQEFEVHRGINPYIIEDILHSNLQQALPDTAGYGPGINWQPRPHLEVQAEWQWQKIPTVSTKAWVDMAYLMLHFYL